MALNSFYIVGREKWGALPPTIKVALRRPILFVKTIVLSEERKCYNEDECFEQLRDLQIRDMRSGLTDIRANFFIADDGRVYQGRGWFNTAPNNPNSHLTKDLLVIAHLGGSPDEEFRDELMRLKMHLLDFGMKKKYVAKFHSIVD
ncbi:peptidoglycan recognition protein 1-like [Macrosteles quadrilineatus]|uniref:peptidoglycan recognition protein 1-like n=1 Tax=Macrosteles quadrilineatus TaxID=74068 RepID=UPI0023E20EA6|nr:peptidoglycan recognition protein 1-like [Macrosteles quadrilineatus]